MSQRDYSDTSDGRPDHNLSSASIEVFELLSERGRGLSVEDVAERNDMEYNEAKEAVHDLWDKSLVVSNTDFEFEADPYLAPEIRE